MLVDMHEAKTRLSRLVERALASEEIIIAKAGRPVARIVPYEKQPELVPGRWRAQVRIAPDFDDTPAEPVEIFEGS